MRAVAAGRTDEARRPAEPLQVVEAIRIGPEPRLELTHGPRIVLAGARTLHALSLLRLNGYPQTTLIIVVQDCYRRRHSSSPAAQRVACVRRGEAVGGTLGIDRDGRMHHDWDDTAMGKDELRVAEETILPNEDAVIDEFVEFLKRASERRHPSGELRRFNQPRHAGCAHAQLIVSDDLAAELKVGVFARPGAYDARVRFASASPGTDRDRDIRGMSIRVEGVPGSNLTAGATTQDFILNSHPVMVARDTREFLGLLRAADAGGVRRILYFLTHLRAARIGLAARQHPTCHLDIPYWSTTPYLFGEGRAVKYLARPTSGRTSVLPDTLSDDYLRRAMTDHLRDSEATFDLMVQFQQDPSTTLSDLEFDRAQRFDALLVAGPLSE